ncbi:hypothetical protein HSR122_1459 [Halapricum desulfuricans]|uniref:Uncharacterized protein n=1 Tax=Halapricum desulfuricans TaxID=2841257 RepID=A0A897NCR7_9EURY|nr:hypothetical protein HSR122_1459 [Halapricum desulfuricans]
MFAGSTPDLQQPQIFRVSAIEQIADERAVPVVVPLRLDRVVEFRIVGV